VSLPAVHLDELENRYYGDDFHMKFTPTYLTTKLADAVALIEQEYPTVESRLQSGALLTQNYHRVVADMVLRVINNPRGYASESDGGYSYGLRAVVSSGDLWLTQKDIDLLFGRVQNADLGTVTIGVHDPGRRRGPAR
jgi:hypothetical protein